MAQSEIFWKPELFPEAEEMDTAFLAEIFAPIIRERLLRQSV